MDEKPVAMLNDSESSVGKYYNHCFAGGQVVPSDSERRVVDD
jgi:murein endopeptidase